MPRTSRPIVSRLPGGRRSRSSSTSRTSAARRVRWYCRSNATSLRQAASDAGAGVGNQSLPGRAKAPRFSPVSRRHATYFQ